MLISMLKKRLRLLVVALSYFLFFVFPVQELCAHPHSQLSIPPSISEQLEANGSKVFPLKKHYKNTTVLFADMVNFTDMSSTTHPDEAYEFLKNFYSEAEKLASYYPGIWIVKYEGDKIMAVIGAPDEIDAKEGAKKMVDFSIKLLDIVKHRKYRLNEEPLDLRIGLSSGDLIGGIISETKYLWDIIGLTVNKASRMESNGEAGKITISEETKNLIQDSYGYSKPRFIDIKGIGNEPVYSIIMQDKSI